MALGAGLRRLVGGFNLILNVLLIIALAFLVIWAAGRFGRQWDVTRSGVNSLSPRTELLLRGLDENVRMTSVYSTLAKDVRPYAEKHANMVSDLLALYDRAGGARVATYRIDPKHDSREIRDLLERLKKSPTVEEQMRPFIQAMDDFRELNLAISKLLEDESVALRALAQVDGRLAETPQLVTLERNATSLVQTAQDINRQVEQLTSDETPSYGPMRDAISEYLLRVTTVLESHRDWMSGPGAQTPGLSPDSRAFLAAAVDRYVLVLERAGKLMDELRELPAPELDNIVEQLRSAQCVVVEVGDRVRAVSHDDIWSFRIARDAPPSPDNDPRDFTGEQAISSALLRLTQKDRTAVVFARYGGSPLLTPDFSQMNPMAPTQLEARFEQLSQAMEQENFIVREWDLQVTPEPPQIEDAARTVYVVFPPSPPSDARMPPMLSTLNPVQKAGLLNAIDQSGLAMFLVGWSGGGFPGQTPEYAFADYLSEQWGVTVDNRYLAFSFRPSTETPGLYMPRGGIVLSGEELAFGDHPIARAVQGMTAGLNAPTPLTLADAPPNGARLTPLLSARRSEDVWAFHDMMRIREDFDRRRGTRMYEDDLPSPFVLAAAGERESDDRKRRLVVFGSEEFASNEMLNAGMLLNLGGQFVIAQQYPANRDLFINALHWLTGDASRIALGPSRGDVPRLSKLTNEEMFRIGGYSVSTVDFLRAFVVGVWPGLALLCGAFVWFMRRR